VDRAVNRAVAMKKAVNRAGALNRARAVNEAVNGAALCLLFTSILSMHFVTSLTPLPSHPPPIHCSMYCLLLTAHSLPIHCLLIVCSLCTLSPFVTPLTPLTSLNPSHIFRPSFSSFHFSISPLLFSFTLSFTYPSHSVHSHLFSTRFHCSFSLSYFSLLTPLLRLSFLSCSLSFLLNLLSSFSPFWLYPLLLLFLLFLPPLDSLLSLFSLVLTLLFAVTRARAIAINRAVHRA
jgi:hypothetical protein